MATRVIASILALMLAWTGLATQERAMSVALTDAERAEFRVPAPLPLERGSVDDHHLDDLPAQAHAEHLADLPALWPAQALEPRSLLTMARPWPWSMGQRAAPCLDGLQRPPCSARPTA